MLRKIRIVLAVISFALITLLFLDFTGTLHTCFGWLAKIQLLPAVLALNVGVVVALLILTLLFGRVYCSVICPMGVFQDLMAWFGKKSKKNRYAYSSAKNWLRYSILALFIVLMVAGVNSVAILVAPYSAYGRIVSNLFAPIYQWVNNLLAYFAERADSYMFYSMDVWLKSMPTFIVAAVTLIVIVVLAWRNGRTYCNTICPVGTVLGFVSKFSLFKLVINTDKCNGCTLCARNCKAACINAKEHKIDYSRCVMCMDCVEKCNQQAFAFALKSKKTSKTENTTGTDSSRRSFLTISALFATTALLKAQEKKVDGGLAVIEDKKIPKRSVSPKPAGSLSVKNFSQHCTACQLCVSACPNQVLRPSSNLMTLMQPEMSFERGYCRPECTKCSEVCPAGAIKPIKPEEKSSIQIGHAVWIKENCVVNTNEVSCGNCARHCPVGAITMIPKDDSPDALLIPAVNTERCIGCGACENLCPARPLSAIYVEGHEVHKFN